jgi:hypothetical protein
MPNTDFRYSIHFKVNDANKKIIILNQKPFFKGKEAEIQIPVDDIDKIIYSLKNAKEEASSAQAAGLFNEHKVELDQSIVNTLVSLYLSGIPIDVLSSQYSIEEPIIRYNLEEKGIILMDEM